MRKSFWVIMIGGLVLLAAVFMIKSYDSYAFKVNEYHSKKSVDDKKIIVEEIKEKSERKDDTIAIYTKKLEGLLVQANNARRVAENMRDLAEHMRKSATMSKESANQNSDMATKQYYELKNQYQKLLEKLETMKNEESPNLTLSPIIVRDTIYQIDTVFYKKDQIKKLILK